jgi:hypothetical protein
MNHPTLRIIDDVPNDITPTDRSHVPTPYGVGLVRRDARVKADRP